MEREMQNSQQVHLSQATGTGPNADAPRMLTLQEIFDKAVGGVIAQGGGSYCVVAGKSTRCMYRGPEGRKCAVGQVMPDTVYREHMDENGGVAARAAVAQRTAEWLAAGIDVDKPKVRELLIALQGSGHDNAAQQDAQAPGCFMQVFKIKALEVGSQFDLDSIAKVESA